MKKGILKAVTFYGVGILATVLSYLAFGDAYGHGPSPYHLVAILTFFGGALWTTRAFLTFSDEKTEERKGIILTNLSVLIGTFLIFYVTVIRPEQIGSARETSEEKMTTRVNGDTTTIDINGQIIYIKVKDSVYLDFTDSIK